MSDSQNKIIGEVDPENSTLKSAEPLCENSSTRLDSIPEQNASAKNQETQLSNLRAENKRNFDAAAAAVLAELRENGIHVESDFKEVLKLDKASYRIAVQIMSKWLTQLHDPRVRESIVRALSTKYAKEAIPELISEFRRIDESEFPGLHWAVGNALEILADPAYAPELIELVKDRRYGKSRQMLALGLGKIDKPDVVKVLIDLLNDPDVCGHSVAALRKLGDPQARSALEPFLSHRQPWIRNEAKKALAKFDRKESNSPN